ACARADDRKVAMHPVRFGETELPPRVVLVSAPPAEAEATSVDFDPAAGTAGGDRRAPGATAWDDGGWIPARLMGPELPGPDGGARAFREDLKAGGAGA